MPGTGPGHPTGMALPLDTAVLDIDGTLLDSNYHHTLAWSRAFAAAGRPVALWRLHRAIGMGGDRLVSAVTDDDTEADIGDEVRDRWEHCYDEIIGETRLFDGARELLEALRDAGLAVVLASSSIPRHADHALRLLDAGSRTDAWTTSEDADESKPHPELLDRAVEKVGGRAPVMVGDSVWDVEAAARRGVPTIALLCGGSGRDELVEAGAVAVVRDPADLVESLPRLLDRMGAAR
jgi:HAD superfamily hydrolase (TIGR01549 family)